MTTGRHSYVITLNEPQASCLTHAGVELRNLYSADDMCLFELDRNAMLLDNTALYTFRQREFG